MALMTTEQKAEAYRQLRDVLQGRRDEVSCTRDDVKAAVDVVDGLLDSVAASWNQALPTAAKNGLSAAAKASLIAVVAQVKYGGS